MSRNVNMQKQQIGNNKNLTHSQFFIAISIEIVVLRRNFKDKLVFQNKITLNCTVLPLFFLSKK